MTEPPATPARGVRPDPNRALVAVVMGSTSDWETMRHCDETLDDFAIPHACMVVSAHRTPQRLAVFAGGAAAAGYEIVIAAAGGAAHLPGMIAAHTHLPVLGVPIESGSLKGIDALLSIVQMPRGVPVGTLAIGRSGAVNAALLAVSVLALARPELQERLQQFRREQQRRAETGELPTANYRREIGR